MEKIIDNIHIPNNGVVFNNKTDWENVELVDWLSGGLFSTVRFNNDGTVDLLRGQQSDTIAWHTWYDVVTVDASQYTIYWTVTENTNGGGFGFPGGVIGVENSQPLTNGVSFSFSGTSTANTATYSNVYIKGPDNVSTSMHEIIVSTQLSEPLSNGQDIEIVYTSGGSTNYIYTLYFLTDGTFNGSWNYVYGPGGAPGNWIQGTPGPWVDTGGSFITGASGYSATWSNVVISGGSYDPTFSVLNALSGAVTNGQAGNLSNGLNFNLETDHRTGATNTSTVTFTLVLENDASGVTESYNVSLTVNE